ncbi:hypothetical protein [Endozoicomonas numazuensis]|uniref:Uncharacterized protein n=1 Tax=Endozoicomonas numazuensis TaxID=1137799 RepID=A0A081NM57_9GAMM|nr:hypothetical protein [Endozoicomonas numazuensis]KEQ19530.1 hypothetical protein GZ78_06335 [Endozoicomonas numazuensis]
MQHVRIILTLALFILIPRLSIAAECRVGVLNIPESHWLRQQDVETQKKVIVWLGIRNSYFCDRMLMAEEMMQDIEEAARTGNRDELDFNINLSISLVPSEKKRAEIVFLVGEKRLNGLVTNHPESFDPIATGEAWGIIPVFPEGSQDQ